jgi:hypothetical protein
MKMYLLNFNREWVYTAESLDMFVLKTVATGRWRLTCDSCAFGKKIFVRCLRLKLRTEHWLNASLMEEASHALLTLPWHFL